MFEAEGTASGKALRWAEAGMFEGQKEASVAGVEWLAGRREGDELGQAMWGCGLWQRSLQSRPEPRVLGRSLGIA